MSPDKRGFVFTIDAFVALVLVSLIILVIVYQLNIPSAFFPQQAQTYDYARDVVGTLSASTIGDLKLTGGYPQADSYSPTEDEHTVLEQMAKEILNNNNPGALALATQLLTSGTSPLIPVQYGVKIGVKNAAGSWQEITVRDRPFTRIQSSANYVIAGYLVSRNPNSASRYDYPPNAPLSTYCDGSDNVAMPCAPLASYGTGRYVGGSLLGPTMVRVSVWT